MRTPKAGTTMGKCTFCKDYIVQGDSNRAKHATVKSGHWLCGDCVIGMKDIVIAAFMDYHNEAEQEKKELLAKVEKYGWSVNPDTGKLQKL